MLALARRLAHLEARAVPADPTLTDAERAAAIEALFEGGSLVTVESGDFAPGPAAVADYDRMTQLADILNAARARGDYEQHWPSARCP